MVVAAGALGLNVIATEPAGRVRSCDDTGRGDGLARVRALLTIALDGVDRQEVGRVLRVRGVCWVGRTGFSRFGAVW